MLLVQKSDSHKGIFPFHCLCQVFVLIFTLLRDEALASEPEPGDPARVIHQQQQIHDRVRPAQENNLQAEYGHPGTWAGFCSGADSSVRPYVCMGRLSPGTVSRSPAEVHGGAWRAIQLSSCRVSVLGYTGPRSWLSTGCGEMLDTVVDCRNTVGICFGILWYPESHLWDAYM